MHRYGAQRYFHSVGFVLAIITQYNELYNVLFSTLLLDFNLEVTISVEIRYIIWKRALSMCHWDKINLRCKLFHVINNKNTQKIYWRWEGPHPLTKMVTLGFMGEGRNKGEMTTNRCSKTLVTDIRKKNSLLHCYKLFGFTSPANIRFGNLRKQTIWSNEKKFIKEV